VADDYVKSQTQFTQLYDGFGFYGTLATITNDEMYKVRLASQGTLTYSGVPVTLPRSITVSNNWNYLPCPYQTATALSAGLPTITYAQDDLIKSQTVFSTYYDGFGWFGNLAEMDSGQGYKLKVATGALGTFQASRRQLQAAPPRAKAVAAPVLGGWSLDAPRFVDSMTITALVNIDGLDQAAGTLAAFVGDEVRGLQPQPSMAPFGPHAGKPLYSMTVYVNAGETASFRFHDGKAERAITNTLPAEIDGNVGSAVAPHQLYGKKPGKSSNVSLLAKLRKML